MGTGRGKRLAGYVPDYVVFDLETTGIDPESDAIIEISAVKAMGGRVTDVFSTLVNPERPIPFRATQVNGITDGMVAEAPKLKEALDGFLGFIGDAVLVGHNIQTFDMKFLCRAADSFGLEVANDFVDTLPMARACLTGLARHRLVDVAAYFHVDTEGAHRALEDCRMNQLCYEELGKLQKDAPAMACPKCGGELRKRSGRFGEFYGCCNFPDCRYTRNVGGGRPRKAK